MNIDRLPLDAQINLLDFYENLPKYMYSNLIEIVHLLYRNYNYALENHDFMNNNIYNMVFSIALLKHSNASSIRPFFCNPNPLPHHEVDSSGFRLNALLKDSIQASYLSKL